MAKCFIIFGSINKKLILLFVACLIQTIYSVINIFGEREQDYVLNSTFLNWIVISLGQMLVRFYPCILKITNEQKPNIKITIKKKFLHYFFLCLIMVSMVVLEYFSDFYIKRKIRKPFGQSNNLFPSNNPIIICFEIIFLICISKWILKYKYFKHHIISLIAFILIGLVFFLAYFINSSIEIFIAVTIMRILQAALDAIYRCYQKYMMEKLYYPYWNIAFVPGVFLFPIALVLFIIQLVFYTENDIKMDLTNFIIFKIVLPLIFNVIMSPLTILIVYYFPPDYILIISLLSSIVRTLRFCIKFLTLRYISISIPLHIIQIFVMLIYLEILELNFCGLNKNTRRNIHLRSESDSTISQSETISEDSNTDIDLNSNNPLEKEEKINEDTKTEEDKEDEKLINS